MEYTDSVRLTKLAKCAGCGAKVGAGTLTELLKDFKSHRDNNLIVGFDKSDDACVYKINEDTAIIETVDFFPPIVDDPYLFGQIAATNALSDIYAMGADPKLALNLLAVSKDMEDTTVREILRGGYDKVYEAGAIITGGHTINALEPFYGLSVTGFSHPKRIITNSGAREGDVLILTKPLGVGILMTALKAGMLEDSDNQVPACLYSQMSCLNKTAKDVMVKYEVHACTDVTGFSLLGHTLEMAEGSGVHISLFADNIPYHREALKYADMGLIPEGAYRNRDFCKGRVDVEAIPRNLQDVFFDPQTSGGLLFAINPNQAEKCLDEIKTAISTKMGPTDKTLLPAVIGEVKAGGGVSVK